MTAKDVSNAMEQSGFAFRKAKKPHRIVESWMSKSRPYHPELLTAVALAKVLGTTVEELAEGKVGAEYVRQLVRNTGGVWEPPERIADIVDDLLILDDSQLDMIRASAHIAAESKRGQSTGTEGLVG